MATQHVVIGPDGDILGRVDLPRGVAFTVPEEHRVMECEHVTDEGYDWFYSLPVYEGCIEHGYVGWN